MKVLSDNRPPDHESFHIGRARRAYVEGKLTIDEFEDAVAHVLGGGHLGFDSRVPRPGEIPFNPDVIGVL